MSDIGNEETSEASERLRSDSPPLATPTEYLALALVVMAMGIALIIALNAFA